jgi:hypothetical protein
MPAPSASTLRVARKAVGGGVASEKRRIAAGRAPATPFVIVAAEAAVIALLAALALFVVAFALWLT